MRRPLGLAALDQPAAWVSNAGTGSVRTRGPAANPDHAGRPTEYRHRENRFRPASARHPEHHRPVPTPGHNVESFDLTTPRHIDGALLVTRPGHNAFQPANGRCRRTWPVRSPWPRRRVPDLPGHQGPQTRLRVFWATPASKSRLTPTRPSSSKSMPPPLRPSPPWFPAATPSTPTNGSHPRPRRRIHRLRRDRRLRRYNPRSPRHGRAAHDPSGRSTDHLGSSDSRTPA